MDLGQTLKGAVGGVLGLVFTQAHAAENTRDPDAALRVCAAQVIRENAPRGAEITRNRTNVADTFGYVARGQSHHELGGIAILAGPGGIGSLITHSAHDNGRNGAMAGIQADKNYPDRPARNLQPDTSPDVTSPAGDPALGAAARQTSAKLLDGMRRCTGMDLVS